MAGVLIFGEQSGGIPRSSFYRDKSFIETSIAPFPKQGKRSYNFKHIEEWKAAKENLVAIEMKCKASLALDDLEFIDQDTGEVKTLEVPKVKFAKDSIIFK